MVAIHNGTANINIRNVNNMKCVNCKHCINYENGYYWCSMISDKIELIEECIANDDDLGCDGYVEDSNDDTTA